jgi:hypothetical protein
MMDFNKINFILKRKDCLNDQRNFMFAYNRVRFHNIYETKEHFTAKALLTFMLFKSGKASISEAEMRNGRVIDTLQVCKNGDLVGYEIESVHNTKQDVENVDMIEIQLKEMPESARQGILDLSKWLEQFIV